MRRHFGLISLKECGLRRRPKRCEEGDIPKLRCEALDVSMADLVQILIKTTINICRVCSPRLATSLLEQRQQQHFSRYFMLCHRQPLYRQPNCKARWFPKSRTSYLSRCSLFRLPPAKCSNHERDEAKTPSATSTSICEDLRASYTSGGSHELQLVWAYSTASCYQP